MTAILTDLEPLEVSLVDRAANKRSFLIMKSEKGISEENQKDQPSESPQEDQTSENIENNSDTQGSSTTTTEESEPSAQQPADNAEGEVAAPSEEQAAEGTESDSSDVEKSADASSKILKSESGDISVDLNLLPANVRGQIETLFKSHDDEIKKAAHFESLFKKQMEERETREFVEKASSFKNLPIKTESLGSILKSAFHAMPKEHYDELEKVLKSANDKMEPFFKEAGQNSGTTECLGDAYEKLSALGDQIAKAENLSSAQGFKLAVDRNPDLYKETRAKK